MDLRIIQLAQLRGDALVLLRSGATEELQCDVPGFCCRPANTVLFAYLGAEFMDCGSEVVGSSGGEWDSDEQSHGSFAALRGRCVLNHTDTNYLAVLAPMTDARVLVASRRALSGVR